MTQNIVNLLVVSGLSLNEAVEMAEVENLVAESAYVDYTAEEAEDAEYTRYINSIVDLNDICVIDGDVCARDIQASAYYGYPVYRILEYLMF